MINSPQHRLAQWLARQISPIRTKLSHFGLKDSFQLKDTLSDIDYRQCFLASYDIASLFTNVPVTEAVEEVCEYASEIGFEATELRALLKLCVRNVQFVFNGTIFRQINGVAMGSPLGPILADIFMSKLENNI
ncbi:unnamed protein product [Echinostoma caproni]|uniref:Reverse transcriptase domain-containing protein n=1 Tax=Echinostoma caproni TaxID=27848 RepID=A0A183AJ05_9TREM|nr:unnamed protein product [Echinostoma caproni]